MEVLLAKGLGQTLHPADDESAEQLRRLGRGEILRFTARRPRNLGHHRKFFALLDLLYENQELYTDREQFRRAVIIEAGHFDDQRLLDGTVVRTARSISFASMDQSAFEAVYDSVVAVALTALLPGIDRQDLEQEVEAFASSRW
jgi:hypothetical protein